MTHPSPPLKWLLAYRLFGLRLPDQYVPWVVEDTKSRLFLTWRAGRTFVWLVALIGLYAVGQYYGLGEWPRTLTLGRLVIVALAIALFSSREQLVRRTLRWHRVDKHGNPSARVRRFARLDNREAALLGLAAVVAWTGGATALGYGLRPTGIAAVPCREAEPAVFDRIRAGATGSPEYLTTRMVRFEGGDIVLAVVAAPKGQPDAKPSIEAWIVRGDVIERISGPEQATTTRFPRFDDQVDRIAGQALERAAQCLSQKPVR